MTKHYDLIDIAPGDIYQQKMYAALRLVSVCKCV
jgi:hypothetical protein